MLTEIAHQDGQVADLDIEIDIDLLQHRLGDGGQPPRIRIGPGGIGQAEAIEWPVTCRLHQLLRFGNAGG